MIRDGVRWISAKELATKYMFMCLSLAGEAGGRSMVVARTLRAGTVMILCTYWLFWRCLDIYGVCVMSASWSSIASSAVIARVRRLILDVVVVVASLSQLSLRNRLCRP